MSDGTLVDSNILIDVASEDAHWFACSAGQLAIAANQGMVGINPLIYAEFCRDYGSATRPTPPYRPALNV